MPHNIAPSIGPLKVVQSAPVDAYVQIKGFITECDTQTQFWKLCVKSKFDLKIDADS